MSKTVGAARARGMVVGTVTLSLGALLGIASVGATAGASSHGSKSITKQAAAGQYLADDSAFAAARTSFQTEFTTWHNAHEPSSETTAFVTPFVTACQAFQHELKTQRWPSADASTVRRFAASLGVIAQDVRTLPNVTEATGTAWAAKLSKDSTSSISDADSLRHKLGLAKVS